MKLIMFTLTALISLASFTAKAQDVTVSAVVVNSFNSAFKNAADVQWKDGGNYYKADFTLNGQYVTAFYNANAGLMAVTKNISPVQLPVTLQTSLKASYEDYWVSELFELSDDSGVSYYVTVENGDAKVTLKSNGGSWSTFKKSRKS